MLWLCIGLPSACWLSCVRIVCDVMYFCLSYCIILCVWCSPPSFITNPHTLLVKLNCWVLSEYRDYNWIAVRGPLYTLKCRVFCGVVIMCVCVCVCQFGESHDYPTICNRMIRKHISISQHLPPTVASTTTSQVFVTTTKEECDKNGRSNSYLPVGSPR